MDRSLTDRFAGTVRTGNTSTMRMKKNVCSVAQDRMGVVAGAARLANISMAAGQTSVFTAALHPMVQAAGTAHTENMRNKSDF